MSHLRKAITMRVKTWFVKAVGLKANTMESMVVLTMTRTPPVIL